jgi:hypothetical protein
MEQKKQSYRERMETEEMLKFEMDSDNPFADGSFRSYKAKNRKKPTEKEEKPKGKNITDVETDQDTLPF